METMRPQAGGFFDESGAGALPETAAAAPDFFFQTRGLALC
jgi:hypothetical protein